MAAQAAGKIHVFHQRNVGEAAKSIENLSPYEQRLISEERAEPAAAQSFPRFEPAQVWMPFIEPTPERAATERQISSQRAFEALQVCFGQFSIRMMKEEHIARRGSGRFVHLVPASWLTAMDGPKTRWLGFRSGAFSCRRHDHLTHGRIL